MLVRSRKEGITRSRLSADKVRKCRTRKYNALRTVLSGRYTLRKLQLCVENKLKIVFRERFFWLKNFLNVGGLSFSVLF